MGSIKGKLEVDLYANPDPFIQGMKAAENSAKKSGEGIAGHLEKINKKQIKGLTHELLGGLGTLGLIDEGAKMALELAKGFKEGGVKNFSDAVSVVGNTLVTGLKAIPIAGTFLAIGEQIGNMVFGVDKANESIKLMNDQMTRTTEISKLLFASKTTSDSIMAALQKKNDDLGKSSDQTASEFFVENKKKEIEAIRLKMNADVAAREIAMGKEEDQTGPILSETRTLQSNGTTVIKQNRELLYTQKKIDEETARGYNLAKSTADAAIANIVAETQAYEDLQKKYNEGILAQQQFKSEQDEILKEYDNQDAAQEQINKLIDKANETSMSARDVELERLSNMDGITASMLSQGIAAWDLVEAGKASKTLVEQTLAAQKTANEDYSSGIEASIELNRAKANRTASATSVDSALGSIKLQGVTDFSKSKEIEKAKEALSKAIETASNTKGTYDQLVKLNQAIGATP